MDNDFIYKQGGSGNSTITFILNDKCRVFELINNTKSESVIRFRTNSMTNYCINLEAGEMNTLLLDAFDKVTVEVDSPNASYKWQAYGLSNNK